MVSWSIRAFARVPGIGAIVLAARPQDTDLVEWVLDREVNGISVEVVNGGETRQESELKALRHLSERVDLGEIDIVLLHDGARPLVSPSLIEGVLHGAREYGGAIPGLPADDVRFVGDDGSLGPPSFSNMVRAQTPQGFRAPALIDAYEQAAREGFTGTDTSAVMERYSSLPVHWLRGEQNNLKVTYPQDLLDAEGILASSNYVT